MTSMWASLVPLILISALMPVELGTTIMLLGTPSRTRTAAASVAGMIVVRLLQGLTFGSILHLGRRDELRGDDPDAPPPKWMTMLSSMTPGKAFFFGAGVVLLSVKLWIFTFAAIGVIGHAHLGRTDNVITQIVFVLLAVSAHLAVVGAAAIFPARSKSLLDGAQRWLQHHNRMIMIVLGLVFGVFFLFKALHGFGIL